MYSLLRRALFLLPPEPANNLALSALARISRRPALCRLLTRTHPPAPAKQVMGITFPNPIGLASGLDKNATAINALHALGFGWIEVGTITPKPQPGNPAPRLFRLPAQRALINRLGLNNVGIDQFLANLAHADSRIIKGISIGANTKTPPAKVPEDFITCLRAVYPHAHYISLNASCPNIPHHKNFPLKNLLQKIHHEALHLADRHGTRTPLVLKIAPATDTNPKTLDHIANLARQYKIDGIAATNTLSHKRGGLSGPPLSAPSTQTIAHLHRNLQNEIPIIGCGGIDSPAAAREKLQAGASLLQIYTGFVYHGPKLIHQIIRDLHPAPTRATRPATTTPTPAPAA